MMTIGYDKNLEIIPKSDNRDIDVLVYGSINKRRKELLESLSEKAGLVVLAGKYGNEGDEVLSRSRIDLNMHYYKTKTLKSVRVAYLLNSSVLVVIDTSADDAVPRSV